MDSLSAAEVRDAGLVIAFARRIESRMTELGATAAGLHDKTDFLAPKLSMETVKKLHFIGAVRNRAAHEDCRFTPEEMHDYTEACNQVLKELAALGSTKVAEVSMPVPEEPKVPRKPRPSPMEPAPQSNGNFWTFCALIPGVHVLYLGMVLLRNCADVLDDLFALGFELLSLYCLASGIRFRQPAGIWFGAILLVLLWLFACIRAQSGKLCARLPKIWKYFPVLNGIVFPLRAAEDFRYVETAFVLLGLAATFFGALLFRDNWKLGLGISLAGYASSVFLRLLRRFRKE